MNIYSRQNPSRDSQYITPSPQCQTPYLAMSHTNLSIAISIPLAPPPAANHFCTGGGIKSSNPFSSAFASSNNLCSPRFFICTYPPISFLFTPLEDESVPPHKLYIPRKVPDKGSSRCLPLSDTCNFSYGMVKLGRGTSSCTTR